MIKFPLLTPYDISENRFPLYQHLKSLLFVKKLLPSTVQTSRSSQSEQIWFGAAPGLLGVSVAQLVEQVICWFEGHWLDP